MGSLVGQLAKARGLRVVGIAGGPAKCELAVKELGFDACLDHRDPDLAAHLAQACPKGIDIYFENVGGKVFEAVLPLLNTGARIPVCGLIAQHTTPRNCPRLPDRSPLLMRTLLTKRIRMQGFIIFDDYGHRLPEFLTAMTPEVLAGRIKVIEEVVEGLNSPGSLHRPAGGSEHRQAGGSRRFR